MYCLYPLNSSPQDSGELLLCYEWGESFDNHEWRPCVEHFLKEVTNLGHAVVPLTSPAFTPGEDFVEIEYLIDGIKTTFTSDHLLSLITIQPEDPSVLRGAWEAIGNKVGWEQQRSQTSMPNKPKKWIAALLGLFSPPVGMMYAAQAKLALAYLCLAIVLGLLGIFSSAWNAATGYLSLLVAVVSASHAYLLAKKYPDERPRPAYSRWYGILGTGVCLVVLVVITRAFFYEPFRSPSASMLPTVPVRAKLVVQKWGYGNYGAYGLSLLHAPISSSLTRGDLIVFELPSDRSVSYVKRLVGLPGDNIAYRGKQLFINGNAVPLRLDGDYYDPESLRYIPRFVESLPGAEYSVLLENRPGIATAGAPQFPFSERCTYAAGEISCEVPAGHFFAIGDNRDNSNDSRMWGFVPADHIVGKVVFIGS